MTYSEPQQMTIKFKPARRSPLKETDAVPAQWLTELLSLRRKYNISNALLAYMTGYSSSKISTMLNGIQRVSKTEYAALKLALDKLTGKAPLAPNEHAPEVSSFSPSPAKSQTQNQNMPPHPETETQNRKPIPENAPAPAKSQSQAAIQKALDDLAADIAEMKEHLRTLTAVIRREMQ